MPGRKFNSNAYRYGFNGHEKDDEIKGDGNSVDFGARIYDPRLGRWLATDRHAYKYPSWSPYSFVDNKPLVATDPDGNDVVFLIAKEGAQGMGHMAILIQDGSGNWYYVTQGAAENAGLSKLILGGVTGGLKLELLNTKDVNKAIAKAKGDASNSPYTDQLILKTSKDEDRQIFKNAEKSKERYDSKDEKYNLIFNNCVDACQKILQAKTDINLPLDLDPRPNAYFNKLEGYINKIQEKVIKKSERVEQKNQKSESSNTKSTNSSQGSYSPPEAATREDANKENHFDSNSGGSDDKGSSSNSADKKE